ncbi:MULTISPECIES: hypothetical protein [Cupriavidus]|uniref:Efflux transporter periplasmic adaptor subunit n=1 Tax=Cupriavidus gilardii TaxID=82541 RepID=A0A6N1BS58_9BURK|nr:MULTISPECIES: hypothetical protein [Cupriavidus]ALD91125.1 hypothetical protein CR3_1913 [Cupriavidus gilardii CR3]QQE06151.1 hypothetical protein IC580_10005 [Cupriavidus sp. ISTL7]MBO4121208.1 hypothetical protein [Cupriavidus gilardii]MCA7084420.1 hypothetical protein [Cupriavidus sp. DB3]MCG5262606.1 hypothetical protein [Cupriavidus gilardii]
MAKILIAFIVIAGAALMLLMQGGGDVSMGGEQHGTETHAPASGEAKTQK